MVVDVLLEQGAFKFAELPVKASQDWLRTDPLLPMVDGLVGKNEFDV